MLFVDIHLERFQASKIYLHSTQAYIIEDTRGISKQIISCRIREYERRIHHCANSLAQMILTQLSPFKYHIITHQDSSSHQTQRVFPPAALLAFPLAPILLWILPGCPLAPAAALLAFSAFFSLSLLAFFSFPLAMASFRAASRASGRCERRSLINSRGAPTMPRCCFTVRRVRFLAASCLWQRFVSGGKFEGGLEGNLVEKDGYHDADDLEG